MIIKCRFDETGIIRCSIYTTHAVSQVQPVADQIAPAVMDAIQRLH